MTQTLFSGKVEAKKQAMASDVGPNASGEAAPRAPQPTHIDVHLHQESEVKLLLSKCSLLNPGAPRPPCRPPAGRLLVASWVVQIVLGVLSVVLGGLLYLGHYSSVRGSGAAIWTGAAAVLAGAVAFIYEKRGGICWALLKTLFALAAFTTAITAIAIGSATFQTYAYFYRGDFCYRDSWRGWPTESPSTDSPEETERIQLCLYYAAMGQAFSLSLLSMLLGVWVLLLLASLTPVYLHFRKRRCSMKEKDQKKLLGESGI